MSPVEHEVVCPRCGGELALAGPLRCACGWASLRAADGALSGRTRPNQDTPWTSPAGSSAP